MDQEIDCLQVRACFEANPGAERAAELLARIEQELRAECEWAWELSLELVAGRHRLDADFIREGEAMLLLNYSHFRLLIGKLLRRQLAISALGAQLEELASLIRGYQRIAAAVSEQPGAEPGAEPGALGRPGC